MTRAFTLFCLLLPIFSIAQDENWVTYTSKHEKGPASIMVNLAAKQSAPDKKLVFLLTTGVSFKECTVEGFPVNNELPLLYDISDSVNYIVSRTIKNNMLVGTFTYQCQRLDYFYLRDTSELRIRLTAFYKKRFPAYTAIINIKVDSSWNTYLKFLYPGEDLFEYMQDEKVVNQLKKAGDDVYKERQIDHWLYFTTDSDRKCIFNYLAEQKFLVESLDRSDRSLYTYSLHISRIDKADLNSISKITKGLRTEAKKCNGLYDGWESPVVK